MIGALPTALTVNGVDYEIRSDYRNILTIFEAYDDADLEDGDKVYITLKRLYVAFETIPRGDQKEAYEQAMRFIECQPHDEEKKSPRTVDWVKDEQLIFPAVNKVAGCEVRALPYLHWWTFLGYFQSVDNEGVWSFVLSIRQKKAKGKKLEKHELEFYNSNRALFEVYKKVKARKAEDDLADLFASLTEGE